MAKSGKLALFEVIAAAQEKQRQQAHAPELRGAGGHMPGMPVDTDVPAPNRPTATIGHSADDFDPTANISAAQLRSMASPAPEADHAEVTMPVQPTPAATPASVPASIPTPAPAAGPSAAGLAALSARFAPSSGRSKPFHVDFDPSAGRFELSLSYTGAAAVALAGLVLSLSVFGVGRWTAGDAPEATLAETGSVAAGVTTMPEVLDVSHETRALPPAQAETPAAAQPAARPTRPVLPPTDIKRVAGRNYVVVQAYPKSERDRAVDTRDVLLEAGIGCTIEQNVPIYPSDWYVVIGTAGFDQISGNRQLDEYCRAISEAGRRYNGPKRFKTFDPTPIRWGR